MLALVDGNIVEMMYCILTAEMSNFKALSYNKSIFFFNLHEMDCYLSSYCLLFED